MVSSLPQVLAYHPLVGVRGLDDKVRVIRADLPDFVSHDELLGVLGRVLGVGTAGEVVEGICAKRGDFGSVGYSGVECVPLELIPPTFGCLPVVEWDHEVRCFQGGNPRA
jgi:hypothetical protein